MERPSAMSRGWLVGLLAVAACSENGDDSTATREDRVSVIAAAAQDRALGNPTFDPDRIIVVDRLGTVDEDAPTLDAVSTPGLRLSDDERAAVEAAVAPHLVEWMAPNAARTFLAAFDPEGGGDLGQVTFVVTLAEPEFGGARATIASELWCGPGCVEGGTVSVERQPDGTWVVTGPDGLQWAS